MAPQEAPGGLLMQGGEALGFEPPKLGLSRGLGEVEPKLRVEPWLWVLAVAWRHGLTELWVPFD
ncbi:hypothetical protein CRG98_014418 [Punica granatum]|uniref:Uncharacterized protein n=1 Tax=Punica granatum TaxID=22663 RepID=A0A2I0K9G2_PUNGR|nr:hypothetical protein CRG98_014418 [Punica granatum]